jgi:hypothetical protein
MRRYIPALAAFTCLLVCAPAQAKWGHDNDCGVSVYPTDTHCYALTGVATPAYATIGYQDAVYAGSRTARSRARATAKTSPISSSTSAHLRLGARMLQQGKPS